MNELNVNLQHSILTLAGNGWSNRRIARELGINRETVGKYLLLARADGVWSPRTDSPDHAGRPLIDLTAGLANAFWRSVRSDVAPLDQATANKRRRSANSIASFAASLFVPAALRAYKEAGLMLPSSVNEFLNALRSGAFTRLPRKHYCPPSDDIVAATLAAWQDLPRDQFLAVGMALAFGLRCGEMAQARWDWFSVQSGRPVVTTTEARVKNHSGGLTVTALDPYYSTFMLCVRREQWDLRGEDYVLSGPPTHRISHVPRQVSAWMRGLGWRTTKALHALRDYSVSQVAMVYGLPDASLWARHASFTLTQQYYNSFVQQHKTTARDQLAARWAVAATPAAFVPKIVSA